MYEAQQNILIQSALTEARDSKFDTVGTLTDKHGVTSAVFDNYHHRVLWDALQTVYTESVSSGKAFTWSDVLGVIETQYRTNGHVDDADYLIGLWNQRMQDARYLGSALLAARELQQSRTRDKFYMLNKTLNERVRTSQDPGKTLVDIGYEIVGIGSAGGAQASSLREAIVAAANAKPVSCGIPWVDERLLYNRFADAGGFSPTMLISWVMPSGQGKTSTCTTFSKLWTARHLPCIIMSAEESRPNLTVRAVSAFTGLPPSIITESIVRVDQNGIQTEEDSMIADTLEHLEKYLFIYEITGNRNEMHSIVRRHRVQFGADVPMLVMVDHIGAMDSGSGNWSRDMEQSAKHLKVMSNEFNVTTIVFAQCGAAMELELREKNYATAFQARGSGGIYHWSDIFIVGCRHSGVPVPGYPADRFKTATALQSGKNRFDNMSRTNGRGDFISRWGVFDFSPILGIMLPQLITDDLSAQMEVVI